MKTFKLSLFDSRNTCIEQTLNAKSFLDALKVAKRLSQKDQGYHHVMVGSENWQDHQFAVCENNQVTEASEAKYFYTTF